MNKKLTLVLIYIISTFSTVIFAQSQVINKQPLNEGISNGQLTKSSIPEKGKMVNSGQLLLYNFNEGSGDIIFDNSSSGTPLNLEISNMSAVSWTPKGLGTNDTAYINTLVASKVIDTCTSTNEVTVEAWIVPALSTQGPLARIVTLSNNYSTQNFAIMQSGDRYVVRMRSTETLPSAIGDGISTAPGTVNTKLTHLAFSRRNDGISTFYINGTVALVDTALDGDLSNWWTTNRFQIANDFGKGAWLGTFYKVAVYGRALDSSEVAANYNLGIDSDNAPKIIVQPQDAGLLVGQTAIFSVKYVGDSSSFQWRLNGTTLLGEIQPTLTIPSVSLSNNLDTYSCIVSNSFGSDTSREAKLFVTALNSRVTTGQLALYTFQEGSGDTIRDVSNIGTPLNMSINTPASIEWKSYGMNVNSASDVYSVTDAAKINEPIIEYGEFSAEAWIKPADLLQSPATIMTLSNLSNAARINFTMDQQGNYLRCWLRTSTTSESGAYIESPVNLLSDSLIHITYVYNKKELAKIYINGLEVINGYALGDLSNWRPDYHLKIANKFVASQPWLGFYNLVSFYDRALSPTEILHNFSQGPINILLNGSPSVLTAQANQPMKVNLAWQDNSTNEDGFIIERKYAAFDFTILDSVLANISSFVDSNVVDTTAYTYRIKAFNLFNESSYSNESSATTILSTLAAPTTLTAVLSLTSLNHAELSWQDNSSNESGFIIERKVEGTKSEFAPLDTVTTNVTAYVDSVLADTTTYSYRVKAYNQFLASDYSNTASVTTLLSTLAAPTTLAAVLSQTSLNHAELTWQDNSSNEEGFIIERKIESVKAEFVAIDTVSANLIEYVDSVLADTTTYSYRVKAYNQFIASDYSNTASVTTLLSTLAAPTTLAAVLNQTSLNHAELTWQDNSSNEEGFIIERMIEGTESEFAPIDTVATNVTAYVDSVLADTTTYSYRVKAYNQFLASDYSNTASVTTLLSTLAAPTTLAAVLSQTSLNHAELTWLDNSSNEEGFIIERMIEGTKSEFSPIDTVATNVTVYVDSVLADTTTYSYRVKAYNQFLASNYSNTASVTTVLSTLAAPSFLYAILHGIDSQYVMLNWNDNSSNELGFVIERKDGNISSSSPFELIDSVGVNITSFVDSTVILDSTYTYRVFAYNQFLISDYSNLADIRVPVELISFAASIINGNVTLRWETATETNNSGFSVQKSKDNVKFTDLTFVKGKGTTTNQTSYSYTDKTALFGHYYYRLKQIDFNGQFQYSKSIEVDLGTPKNFALEQNYPNPFNPSTTIRFALPISAKVTIKLYNALGQEVTNVLSADLTAGIHETVFNASDLSSGVYFYMIKAQGTNGSNFTSTKRMILMK